MTMIARFTQDFETKEPILQIRIVGDGDVALVQELFARALNCWDIAPPQVKELGDLVTNKQIMQDYWLQVNKTPAGAA